MSAYPTVNVYIDDNADGVPETDISSLIVSNIVGSHGNFTLKDSDRTGNAGNIKFTIDNKTGSYSGVSFIGKAVSLKLTYGGRTKQVFFGYVAAATDDGSGPYLPRHIKVVVQDWMHTANNTRLTGLALNTNKRANEALEALMDTLANPPAREEFDAGQEIFANMFDGSGKSAKIFSELDKITKSELGQLYLKFRPDGNGEVLRLEGMYARNPSRPLSTIPVNMSTRGLLKYHGNAAETGYLKYHGNAAESGKLKLDEWDYVEFDRTHYDAEWRGGGALVNEFTATNVFRTTDAADVSLYTLSYPVPIGTTETKVIEGGYTDPNGGTVIQAFDVGISVSDYEFNENQDGTGADLTANLMVNAFFWSNNFVTRFYNRGAPGYLIRLDVQGKGIYKYSPNETRIVNDESKSDLHTEYSDNLTREYSNDLITSKMFATSVVALRRKPNQDWLSASYQGNSSEANLAGFMYLEQGSKVQLSESNPTHTGKFYIEGVKFSIAMAGILDYTWYLKEEVKTLCTPIVVSAPSINAGARVALDYGILPQLANMQRFSYSMWVRRDDTVPFAVLVGNDVDTGSGRRGNYLILSNRTLLFTSYKSPTDGSWEATNAIPNDTNWHHVCLTYDNTTDAADPIIYVDGSTVTVTETGTPSGQTDDNSDCPLRLFNIGPDPSVVGQLYYYDTMRDTSIKDYRIYKNIILTPAQVTTLANNEDDYRLLTEPEMNLVFHGIYVPTANRADYEGTTIENDDFVLDVAQGAGGIPYNEVTTTSATMLTGEAI